MRYKFRSLIKNKIFYPKILKQNEIIWSEEEKRNTKLMKWFEEK